MSAVRRGSEGHPITNGASGAILSWSCGTSPGTIARGSMAPAGAPCDRTPLFSWCRLRRPRGSADDVRPDQLRLRALRPQLPDVLSWTPARLVAHGPEQGVRGPRSPLGSPSHEDPEVTPGLATFTAGAYPAGADGVVAGWVVVGCGFDDGSGDGAVGVGGVDSAGPGPGVPGVDPGWPGAGVSVVGEPVPSPWVSRGPESGASIRGDGAGFSGPGSPPSGIVEVRRTPNITNATRRAAQPSRARRSPDRAPAGTYIILVFGSAAATVPGAPAAMASAASAIAAADGKRSAGSFASARDQPRTGAARRPAAAAGRR